MTAGVLTSGLLRACAALRGGVLGNVGTDLSAHATLTHELHTAESIPTLAAEYLTLARVAQAERWDALLDRSGLTPDQTDEVRESDAYGPLIAALRNAEARGLNISAALPSIVASREVRTADDIAGVLHERVGHWTRANSHSPRPGASRFVAGIIPEALGVTDPDLQRALTERAEAMNRRAHTLAEQAVTTNAAWVQALGPAPAEPARHAAWIRELATVAAYRERWGITSRDPIAADRSSVEKIGHEKRAQAAADRAARLAEPHPHDVDSGEPTVAVTIENGVQL